MHNQEQQQYDAMRQSETSFTKNSVMSCNDEDEVAANRIPNHTKTFAGNPLNNGNRQMINPKRQQPQYQPDCRRSFGTELTNFVNVQQTQSGFLRQVPEGWTKYSKANPECTSLNGAQGVASHQTLLNFHPAQQLEQQTLKDSSSNGQLIHPNYRPNLRGNQPQFGQMLQTGRMNQTATNMQRQRFFAQPMPRKSVGNPQ